MDSVVVVEDDQWQQLRYAPFSFYARTPSDMRLMRAALAEWPAQRCTAIYIGCALGEDFYSWVPLDWGLPVSLQWTVTDILPHCLEVVRDSTKVPIRALEHDFSKGLDRIYDIVIAQHVWQANVEYNKLAMRGLLETRPKLVIARDHKMTIHELNAILPLRTYGIFRHLTPHDPLASPGDGHIIMDTAYFPDGISAMHTSLERIG